MQYQTREKPAQIAGFFVGSDIVNEKGSRGSLLIMQAK
ncbi:hypothetical protein VISI1226_18021 [Vibrio sinaloensis DSM 21326]|uniref:Uncharacterized protein n=1 Tax=Vibrio sinaloensis DSM 21326 TaxID=945550 RepID=E8M772_PHOS4|nr:hypothetical protein VISI1226_18021 [Vibrio sinaloensis DSM 21326]